jgi:hypothetical protein
MYYIIVLKEKSVKKEGFLMKTKYLDQRIYIDFICPNAYWEQFYKDSEDRKEIHNK